MLFDEATCTAINAADEIRMDAEQKAAAMDEEFKAAKKAVEDSEEALFDALAEARGEFKGGVWDSETCHSIDGIGEDYGRRKTTFAVIDRKRRSLNDQANKLGARVFALLAEARDHPLTAGKGGRDPDAWCKVHVVNLLGELVSDQLKRHGVITVADFLNLRRSVLEKAVDDAELPEGVLAHADEVVQGYLERRDRAKAWPSGLKVYSSEHPPTPTLPTSGGSGDGAPTATGTPVKSLPAGKDPGPATSSSGSKTEKKSSRRGGRSDAGVYPWWGHSWSQLAAEAELELPSGRYLVELQKRTPEELMAFLVGEAQRGRAPGEVAGPERSLSMLLRIMAVHIGGDLEAKRPHPFTASAVARLVDALGQRGMLAELWALAPSLEALLAWVPECRKAISLSCTKEQAAASMGKQGAPAEVNVSAPRGGKKRKKQEAAP